jgi:alpha-glucosidase (family GH31 glycosyl hydrolase)
LSQQRYEQEKDRKLPALNKAEKVLFDFEKYVSQKVDLINAQNWNFCRKSKVRKDLQTEVGPKRRQLQSIRDQAKADWEEARAKIDGLSQEEEELKLMEEGLREKWSRIHRVRDNEFKKRGISLETKKSRRAAKREQREAVYSAEQRARSTKKFQRERESADQGEGEYADYRGTYQEVELRAQGEANGQADRRGPPTDRPPDPPPCKGASRGCLQERAATRHPN